MLAAIICGLGCVISLIGVTWIHPIIPTQTYHDYVTYLLNLHNVALALLMQITCMIGNIHLSGIYAAGLYYDNYLIDKLTEQRHIAPEKAMTIICRRAALFTVTLSLLAMYSIITSN
jgi:hypothetical protein